MRCHPYPTLTRAPHNQRRSLRCVCSEVSDARQKLPVKLRLLSQIHSADKATKSAHPRTPRKTTRRAVPSPFTYPKSTAPNTKLAVPKPLKLAVFSISVTSLRISVRCKPHFNSVSHNSLLSINFCSYHLSLQRREF